MLSEIPWTTILQTIVKLASILLKRYQDDTNIKETYCEHLLHSPLLHSLLLFFLLLGASVKDSLKTAEYMVQKREPGACRNMIGYTSHQYSQQGYNKLFTQVTFFKEIYQNSASFYSSVFSSIVEAKLCAVVFISFGVVHNLMTCISHNLLKTILKRKQKQGKALAGRYFLGDKHAKHGYINGVDSLLTAKPLHLISTCRCSFQKMFIF